MKAKNYAAIILAGGLSSRMQQLKPLLPLGNATVTDHIISSFLTNEVDVLLVVGYRHREVAGGIKNKDITIVFNPDFEQGMFSSIQAGVRRLKPIYRAFFILPVDIPLVRPSTIGRMKDAAPENQDKIIYPVFGGKRGHPPLIPARLISEILSWSKTGGLKAFLGTQEELALEIPVADNNILLDIDTMDDYFILQERFRRYEIPTDEECDIILNDICKVSPDRVRHCFEVAKVADVIGQALEKSGHKVDIEAVRIAAKLHDIAKGQRKHDIAGGRILRDLGFGKTGDIVSIHSDLAGGNIHLSLEAKIVFLADKIVEREKLVTLEERYNPLKRPFIITPEIEAAIARRFKIAQDVKQELESLLGYPLEKLFPGLSRDR